MALEDSENDLNETVEVEETKAEVTEDQQDAGSEETEAPVEEMELVLTGDEGSQPNKSNYGIQKRINKLNAKVSAAQQSTSELQGENETLRQQNELLQMARAQQQAVPKGPPDPNDFDDGAKDTKYVEALEAHNREFFKSEMDKHTAAQPAPTAQSDRALERRQTRHYESADKMRVPDFDAVEDKVIGVLGKQAVNVLIGSSDKSAEIIYHLGKNPEMVDEIAEQLKGPGAAAALMNLGALGARLELKPKVQRKQAADPDNELEGSSVSRNTRGERGPSGATFT